MIAASCRISRSTDKILINYSFKYINNAKSWCIENIGNNVDNVGIIEYICLTDYETMETSIYEMEEN